MTTTFQKSRRLVIAAALLVCCAGCAFLGARSRSHGTSVVQFLYAKDPERIDVAAVPVLRLPLRVGIAFVPEGQARPGHLRRASGISEMAKTQLLEKVAAEFRGLPYVKTIQIIPSTYLRPGGGFENLNQVKQMFGLDVVALVAYDQVQFTDEGLLSLAYWTIVGAYLVEGERNDTQTLMEAVVYDLDSRQLLFRAPGASSVRARSTPVNLEEQLREDRTKGFDLATAAMIANLKTELDLFRERVKQAPTEFKIEHRAGYSGGGAVDGVFGVGLLLAMAGAMVHGRPRTPRGQ